MHITFAPRGILQIDEARLIFRNFAGAADKYNRQGDRNFAILIPDKAMADRLIDDGWNVRIRDPRDDQEEPFMYLPVKIKFNDRGPSVYLTTNSVTNQLDEESIGCLDNIDILSADLDIRPYDWNVNGKEGRTAYLQSIHVTQDVDRFAARFGAAKDEDDSLNIPF